MSTKKVRICLLLSIYARLNRLPGHCNILRCDLYLKVALQPDHIPHDYLWARTVPRNPLTRRSWFRTLYHYPQESIKQVCCSILSAVIMILIAMLSIGRLAASQTTAYIRRIHDFLPNHYAQLLLGGSSTWSSRWVVVIFVCVCLSNLSSSGNCNIFVATSRT